jgi:hypothetical protein
MSSRLFKRGARVTAYQTAPLVGGGFTTQNPGYFQPLPNAVVIENLRVRFKIEKSIDRSPNKCELVITNCAPDTRTLISAKPMRVMIEAGYDGDLRHVFTGDARHGYSRYVDGDWETTLQLGDGDRAYRYAQVSRSFPKGTSVAVALQYASSQMGLQLPSDVAASSDLQAQFATGRALQGPARDELRDLLAPYGYHWSIQDGQLVILKDQNAAPGTAFLIAESTGMIGSPEFSYPDKAGQPPTLKAQSLLYTDLVGGALAQVQSEQINGFFRINRLTHTCDTHGDDWTTDVEASPSPNTRAA